MKTKINHAGRELGSKKLLAAVAVLAIAMSVFVGVAAYDEADAADITYISGDIKDDFTVNPGIIAVINGNLNIKNGATFTVEPGATLTINEGVKVTVDGWKFVYETDGDGKVVVDENGNPVVKKDKDGNDVKKNASLAVDDGARAVIKGQLIVGEFGNAKILSNFNEDDDKFYPGTFVYGTVTAQKGASIAIVAEVMKGGVIDVTSAGKKVSSIVGELVVMPDAVVNIAGQVYSEEFEKAGLGIYACGEDLSKAKDKYEYLVAEMGMERAKVGNASDASSLRFTVSAESNTVYMKGQTQDDAPIKKTVIIPSLFVEGKVAASKLTIEKSESLKAFSDRECSKPVELSAKNVIASELTIAKTGGLEVVDDLEVSGKLSVLNEKGKTNLCFKEGTVTVSGTVDFVNGSVCVEANKSKLKISGGTVTVDNSDTTKDVTEFKDITQIFNEFEGAFYLYESTPTTKLIACELADAMAVADGKLVSTVTVHGTDYDPMKKTGGYEVKASFDILADVSLVVVKDLVIGKDAVVTMFVGADLNLDEGRVLVFGKLIDKTGNDALGKKIFSDVIIRDDEMSIITYTSLKIAISEITSGKIELKDDAVIDEDMTIPAGVTVVLGERNMLVSNGVTLTVAGTVDASGTGDLSTAEKDDTDKKAAGKVVVENMVILADSADVYNENGFNVAGVYVKASLDDGTYFVMSVPVYVQNIAEVDEASVQGTVNHTGDLNLAGTADDPKELNIIGTFSVDGSITISFFTINVQKDGVITAVIANTVGAVELMNVKGFEVMTVIADIVDDEDKATLNLSGIPAENKKGKDNIGKIAIVSGILTINSKFDASNLASFGVAAGTTLSIGTMDATVSALKVEGTLDVQKNAKLMVGKDLTVLGIVSVADDGALEVTGDMFVGITKAALTTGAAATVEGKKVEVAKLIYVAAGAAVSEDITKNRKSTEFVVAGSTWVTVYGEEGAPIADLKPAVKDARFEGWMNEKGEKINPTVGKPAKAIAKINENIYSVKVIGDNGIGSVMIDGNTLQKSSNVFFVGDLKAGTHTIEYVLKYGYEGNVVIKVDGTVISGNTFSLSGTSAEDTSVSIDLSGTHQIPNDPVVPEKKDDGMGLTDYLLIVLVVLVVILAVIATMRLMRS